MVSTSIREACGAGHPGGGKELTSQHVERLMAEALQRFRVALPLRSGRHGTSGRCWRDRCQSAIGDRFQECLRCRENPILYSDGTCSQNSLRHTLGLLSERDELTRSNLKSSESVLKQPKDQKSPTTTRSLLIERTFNFGNVQY